jgi:phenylpropionate dioxygenase-like ring-hydroxylating dioxygenase large terminal subunit
MTETHWHAVLRSAKLGKAPVRVRLGADNLVLFRGTDGIAAISDRCPHRSASLSGGRVVGDLIECPYHGWRFDKTGACAQIALHSGPVPNRRVRAWTAREAHGLIFVTDNAAVAEDIVAPTWDAQPKVSRILESHAQVTLADAVENVLDPIHTLFVHKGIIRGASSRKRTVTLQAGIERGELVMRYEGEEQSDGVLSRLLERQRSHAVSRFRRPGVVSLEYWGKAGLNLVTTFYFRNTDTVALQGFAIMTGPRQVGLGWLKAAVFVSLMRVVIAQDLRIMADATANWLAAGRPPHALGPHDVLRPLIERVLAGETGDVAPVRLELDL